MTIPTTKKGLSEALASLEAKRERYPRGADLFGTRDSGKTILLLALADALQRRSELPTPTLRTTSLSDQAVRLRGKVPLETTAYDDSLSDLDGLEGFVLDPSGLRPSLIVSLPHVDPARANVPAWLQCYRDPCRHLIAVGWAPRLHLELCWSVFCFYLEQFNAAAPEGDLREHAKLAFMVATNADHRDALGSTNTDGLNRLLADERLAGARVTVKWSRGEARLTVDGGGLPKDEGRRVVACLREVIEDAVSVARDAEAPIRELLQGLRAEDQVLVLTGRDIIEPTPAWGRQEWLEEINRFFFGPGFVRTNRNAHLLGNVVGKVRADAAVTGELPVYVRDTNSTGLGDLMPVIEEWATVHPRPTAHSPANPSPVAPPETRPTVVAEEGTADLPAYVREALGHAVAVMPLAVLLWLAVSRSVVGLGWTAASVLAVGGALAWARNRLLPPSWQRLSDGGLYLPSTRRPTELAAGGYSFRRGRLDRLRDSAWVVPAGGKRGRLVYGYRSLRRCGEASEFAHKYDLVPSAAACVAVGITLLIQRWI